MIAGRVRGIFWGSGSGMRSKEISTFEPGWPFSRISAYASGISRVAIPLMLSIKSPVLMPCLAAGESGSADTTPT